MVEPDAAVAVTYAAAGAVAETASDGILWFVDAGRFDRAAAVDSVDYCHAIDTDPAAAADLGVRCSLIERH